jgi:hypothetical protein
MAVGTLANEADPEETGTIGFLDPAPQFEQPRIRIIGQGSAETDGTARRHRTTATDSKRMPIVWDAGRLAARRAGLTSRRSVA